ncbi:hypothetical protein F8M41_023195 [Gigaspora margarita]|uniref:F-box domain-containing protein n=1 Tax=Gigaspora margarita TaxID=4874 RepID=A0A8H4ADU9_GIGMA|nr:hypothetical protein F8M41_023195 [Gigaspora margarita]
MASKILTGDVPELMENILNNITEDFHYSLFSCALVSRHWYIYFSGSSGIKSGILHSLGRNEQFFSRLQYLSLGVMSEFSAENATALLSILARNATKIGALRFEEFEPDYDPQVIHALIRIIKSQEELKQFNIVGGFLPKKFQGIISALESQKQSLREVIIEGCGYSTEFKMLMNCENLEILRIRYCDYERILGFFDYNINTLEVVDCEIDGSKIALFFEKSGTLLQRLKLESYDARIDEQPLLLESLKSFCPNITYLDFSNIEFSTQLLDLIADGLKKNPYPRLMAYRK